MNYRLPLAPTRERGPGVRGNAVPVVRNTVLSRQAFGTVPAAHRGS